METKWQFVGNTLLRDIQPKERKEALAQLAPRLGGVLDTDLEWALKFIEDIDTNQAWHWFDLDRETFYTRRCSIFSERIDEIKREVAKLISLGRPVPKSERQLGKHGGDRRSEIVRNQGRQTTLIGRGKAYQLERLKAYPEILAAYNLGKFKTVRAAAIAAGIITPKSTLDQLRSWWKKATEEERNIFRNETG